jgi:hypothetical protein
VIRSSIFMPALSWQCRASYRPVMANRCQGRIGIRFFWDTGRPTADPTSSDSLESGQLFQTGSVCVNGHSFVGSRSIRGPVLHASRLRSRCPGIYPEIRSPPRLGDVFRPRGRERERFSDGYLARRSHTHTGRGNIRCLNITTRRSTWRNSNKNWNSPPCTKS